MQPEQALVVMAVVSQISQFRHTNPGLQPKPLPLVSWQVDTRDGIITESYNTLSKLTEDGNSKLNFHTDEHPFVPWYYKFSGPG